MKNHLETLLPLQLLQLSPHSFSVSAARCSNCCCLCTSNQWCPNQYSKLKPVDKPSTETVLFTNQCEFLLLNSRSKSNHFTSKQRPLILLDFTCVVFLRSSMLVFIFFIAAKKMYQANLWWYARWRCWFVSPLINPWAAHSRKNSLFAKFCGKQKILAFLQWFLQAS